MCPKKNFKRQRTELEFEELGEYLTNLRKNNTSLNQAAAARELGFKTRQQLRNYEIGRTRPSGPILIQLAELYKVPPEEVLAKAYWPQLLLLTAIMEPSELPKKVEDYLKDLEKQLKEEDMQDLTRYAAVLCLRRHLINQR